jgi:hypothetical protein
MQFAITLYRSVCARNRYFKPSSAVAYSSNCDRSTAHKERSHAIHMQRPLERLSSCCGCRSLAHRVPNARVRRFPPIHYDGRKEPKVDHLHAGDGRDTVVTVSEGDDLTYIGVVFARIEKPHSPDPFLTDEFERENNKKKKNHWRPRVVCLVGYEQKNYQRPRVLSRFF